MGNTWWGVTTPCEGGRLGRSSPDDAALVIFNAEDAFVHPSELHWPEVYVPEPIVDFFQSDVLACQGVRDADPVLLPADTAIATDESDFEVSGVFQGRKRPWERPGRGLVDGTGRLLIQGFVRTVVVVLMTKPIEADLLRLEIAAGGTRRLRLEGAVHALMAPVLLRGRGRDQLGEDAQPNPPDGQCG